MTFDVPKGTNVVVNNNNDCDAIVGYYEDANQKIHGFLRIP